jgi:hypothetical protein
VILTHEQAVAVAGFTVHHGPAHVAAVPAFDDARVALSAAYTGDHLRWVLPDGAEVPAWWCRDCRHDLDPDEIEHDTCPLCGGKPRHSTLASAPPTDLAATTMQPTPSHPFRREPSLIALVAWVRAHKGASARLTDVRGRTHTGTLGVTQMSGGSDRLTVRVRDDKRGARSQYATVFERDLHDGPGRRLEVKVGSRYVPWVSVRERAIPSH